MAKHPSESTDPAPNPADQTPDAPEQPVSSGDNEPSENPGSTGNTETGTDENPVLSDMDDLLKEYNAA